MKWLALDIGGANIKISDGESYADSNPFAMWKRKDELAQELRKMIAESPQGEHLVVTMTGELADCFESKRAGIEFILSAVEEAAGGRHTRCYLNDGRVVTLQVAKGMAKEVAASNWHALAVFGGRFAPQGTALLVDVGSTTCDVIPLVDGRPRTDARTDTERLLQKQLLYTGITRSPVCAVSRQVPYRDGLCQVAQELFATMLDVYLILEDVAEDRTVFDTADGRQATKADARSRLARMVCADSDEFHHRDAVTMAHAVAADQVGMLAESIQHVIGDLPTSPLTIVLSGHGEFLALRALKSLNLAPRIVLASRELGVITSRSAAAHALAVLMNEAQGG